MESQNILIAGGSGLVGSHLSGYLSKLGHNVALLTRDPKIDKNITQLHWDPYKNIIDEKALTYDTIINLAGAGIIDKKWSEKRKKELIKSRVVSTSFLKKTFSGRRLKKYIGASAIGIYGNRGSESLFVNSNLGDESDFMVECCKKWEAEATKFSNISESVNIIRIGIVLSRNGGALSKMYLPTKMGFSSYFGKGTQFFSWIHFLDLVRIFEFLLSQKESSIVNGVCDKPVTAKEFSKTLKNVIAPYSLLISIPIFFIRLVMGEMAVVLTNSNKVLPSSLLGKGFKFKYSNLESALKNLKGTT